MPPPIPLFLAARKGPSNTLQKFTLKPYDPATTLRQLAASVLGPDAEVGHAEASSKADSEKTMWDGDSLDYTVDFCVNVCGLRYIRIVFADDEPQFVAARAAAVSKEHNALTALMSAEKQRSERYYWPSL